jgi:hypothetical protein
MNFYLVPSVQVIPPGFQSAISVPKYSASDSTETQFTNFTAITYGVEGYTLVALAADNPGLDAEPDVFAFGVSANKLASSDVLAVDAAFATAKLPSQWVTAGMTWGEVVRQTAQVHLLAQFLSGQASGASIFAGGTTLSSTPAGLQSVSAGVGGVGGGNPSPSTSSLVRAINNSVVGVFDLTDVDQTQTVAEILTSVSQQFTAPIVVGVSVVGVGETI